MQIEQLNVSELIPYARNSRTHSDEQIAQIMASIREFGFTNPVLVDGDGVIIAGHGRVTAAMRLNLKTVPCLRLGHLTDAQKKAYVIADNKLALNSGWDTEMLRIELGELSEQDFNVDVIGFSQDELKVLTAEIEAALPDLPTGDREPYQQMTFTLHDEQAEQVKAAIDRAKEMGPFVDTGNENSNGNALARVCEVFNGLG